MPRFLGANLGSVGAARGESIEVDATVSATPSVLYDAVVLPDGEEAVATLASDGRNLEFLKDQYRHCKPILVLGAAAELLAAAGIPQKLPSGKADPGLIVVGSRDPGSADAFLAALGRHRHFERETDPPLV